MVPLCQEPPGQGRREAALSLFYTVPAQKKIKRIIR